MSTSFKQTSGAALALLAVIALGWYSGVDYLHRGKDQVFWTVEATLAALAVYLFISVKSSVALNMARSTRAIATALTFVFVIAECWYGGIDFVSRGEAQAWAVVYGIYTAALMWSCPIGRPIRYGRLET